MIKRVSKRHPLFLEVTNWKYLWAASPAYTSPMQNEVTHWVKKRRYKPNALQGQHILFQYIILGLQPE